MATWVEDAAGNKCSVEYWGTTEAAQTALNSLKNCRRCVNCSNCLDCSDCSDCSNCSDCSRCSNCSDCSNCSNIAYLYGKNNVLGDPDADPKIVLGQPPIPKIANIHAKVFEAVSKPSALDTWHTCGTTHCRGGWVVHLAGEAGYALERFHDSALAAQLIYRESGYPINPGRFYDTNAEAMADMKALAEGAPAPEVA